MALRGYFHVWRWWQLVHSRHKERLVRTEFANGKLQFYEGPMDEERLVRAEYLAVVEHYAGPKGSERLVRTKRTPHDVR